MKIAVCMKQVPAVSEGAMDPVSGVLLRAGLEAVANIYDLAALEAALQLKEATGAQIHVFTMGPKKAESLLREAFSMGADEGFLICDRAFAGADVLATSYTLMQALNCTGRYDLILCGKQTTDGDTAQVSGALAKWLEIPHLNWVTKIQAVRERVVEVEYSMEQRSVAAEVMIPCLLSVEKDCFIPRMPSLKLKISGRKKPFSTLTLNELTDKDPSHYGLLGSATKVKQIFPPEHTQRRGMVQLDREASVNYVMGALTGYEQEERG